MNTMRLTALGALAAAATGFASLAMAGGPPPWAPAHGWRAKHHYVYYPDAEVYYAPESRRWYWQDRNGWRDGSILPLALRALVRIGGIDIGLDVARPYLRNRQVVQRYGGHHREYWRQDVRHHHGDDEDRDDEHHHRRHNGHHDHGHRGRGHHHDDD